MEALPDDGGGIVAIILMLYGVGVYQLCNPM